MAASHENNAQFLTHNNEKLLAKHPIKLNFVFQTGKKMIACFLLISGFVKMRFFPNGSGVGAYKFVSEVFKDLQLNQTLVLGSNT